MDTLVKLGGIIIVVVLLISLLIYFGLKAKYKYQLKLESLKEKESLDAFQHEKYIKESEQSSKEKIKSQEQRFKLQDKQYEIAWKIIEMFNQKEHLTPEELSCLNAALKLKDEFMRIKVMSLKDE